jgi:hypothetical protein
MDYYEGSATLIAPDGTETPAEVSLRTYQSGNLNEWGGTATVDDFNITASGDSRLKLPNGNERTVVVRTSNALATPMALELSGSGTPPF